MAEIVDARFRAPAWLRSAHLQTLWGPLLRRPPSLPRERETLTLDDGDHLLLDRAGPTPGDGDPLALLLHGLTGCSESLYVLGTQAKLASAGIASVAMNSRGAVRPNNTALSYHAGETEDLDAVIRHLRAGHEGPLLAMGVSLGGSRLLNWLARRDSGALTAAVAVCSPLDLAACASRMDLGLSRIYRRHLLGEMRTAIDRQRRHLQRTNPDEARRLAVLDDAVGARSFWEFDSRVIAPIYGFRDAADYYAQCSAGPHLGGIHTPTRMIQAVDDPFMTPGSLPGRTDLGPGVTLELSPHGGHVGFVTGSPRRPRYWLEERLTAFASAFRP